MTREECIEGMQRTIDEDRNRILVRIHVGYLIHAIRFLKEQMPTVELVQKPIGYADCSNAMLKMWMENVLTDGEYSRIMDKLNKAHEDGKL